jgi:iron complex transport system ATP-binding protein
VRASEEVRLGGLDLLRMLPAERARHLAFMPQLLPAGVGLTVIEGVISALRANPPAEMADRSEELAAAVLDRLGIADLALEPLDRLSGGQRQLAGLAQVIVREPRVLLLDEPTSALDLRHQAEVMAVTRSLAGEGRVVVVLHDLTVAARWADHIVVLSAGRMAAAGPPDAVLTAPLLAEVYGVEARVERCSLGTIQIIVDRPRQ